jgi:hypothetical protein
VNPSSWRRSWSLSAHTVRCDRSTHSSIFGTNGPVKNLVLSASQLLGSMPSEVSASVRLIEHARPERLSHGAHAGHGSTRIIRTSKALPTHQVPDLEGCTRHSCGEPRSPPGASCDVSRTMPTPAPVPARPARRPTRRPCLGHVVPPPRPASPTPSGHPTDRRRHLRRNDRETEVGTEPQSGPRQVVRQQRPDPAHRDGHQPPVLGPQYPHPPDSETHLHRDHPAGLHDDPRRTATGTPPAPAPKSRAPTSRAVASGCARPPTSAPTPPVREPSPTAPTAPTSPAWGPRSPWATPGSSSWATASPIPTTPRKHSAAPSASHGSR